MTKVFDEFKEIAKVPRPSFHEEMIRDYLVAWAEERNIEYYKDDFKNVIMVKEASPGYEEFGALALQAHTDMVCEKNEGVDHDFLKDPIKFYIDGDIVSTRETTSLGADDGLGIASILAVFNDDEIKHPRLYGVFTSAEEEDFSGIENLDMDKISAKHLINIDHCCDNEILCASAGGIDIYARKKLNKIDLDENYKIFRIKVSGLIGGHSGEDIHKGRGNSNIILFRILDSLDFDFYIKDIFGGTYRTAIPRESWIKIAINNSDIDKLKDKIDDARKMFADEFANVENFKIELEELSEDLRVFDKSENKNIIDYVILSPVDVVIMSNIFENLVDTSLNLGEIYFDDNVLTIVQDIRSNFRTQQNFVIKKLERLSTYTGFELEATGYYTSWKYKKDSKLRDLAKKVYDKNNEKETEVLALHAGLECGFFSDKIEGIDIISIGPDSWDFHSPKERFSMSSLDRFYENLVEIIENSKF